MEARGEVETEEGVTVTEVGASEVVLIVLRYFEIRGEQVCVTGHRRNSVGGVWRESVDRPLARRGS